MSRAVERLRQAGLKATGPRVILLTALEQNRSHPTAELLYESLQVDHPSLSLSTVYQTLDAFIRTGLCRRVSEAGNRLRVDGNPTGPRSCDLPRVWRNLRYRSAIPASADAADAFTTRLNRHGTPRGVRRHLRGLPSVGGCRKRLWIVGFATCHHVPGQHGSSAKILVASHRVRGN